MSLQSTHTASGDQDHRADQMSAEQAKFIIDHINNANIQIAGRGRTSTHRRQDHCEALCAIKTGHTSWIWSDQRLQQEFGAALAKWEEKNEASAPADDDTEMIRTILAEMRKRKSDEKSTPMDRFKCL